MAPAMPVLDAKSLCKRLGARVLLEEVDLTVVRGEKVGVVGDNGSGKSTLARILAGRLEADTGTISTRRGATISYLDQEPEFEPGHSALDTALRSHSTWWQARARYEHACGQLSEAAAADSSVQGPMQRQERALAELEALGGFQVADEAGRLLGLLGLDDPQQSVDTMSGGERRRVALAALLLQKPDLAILDEPTNHLDAATIEWLEGYLRDSFNGALLLITHDRWLLSRVVSRTLEVESGRVHSYAGGWEEFLEAKAERQMREEREERNRQNFLRTELEWLRRQPKARTGKQKARISRAEAALSSSGPQRQADLQLQLAETRLGSTILEAQEVRVTVGDRVLVHDLSFQLSAGSRVGIVGPSGAGKTTLLRTLVGDREPHGGRIVRGKNTRFAYLDQMRSGLADDESVQDAVTDGRPSVSVGERSFSSYSYLEKFRFKGDMVRQKVGGLSGGERARVALAKLLQTSANVLVLDEPTNDLDVMTLTALEDLLLGLSGVAIVVSHDRYFLDRVATNVLGLDGDGNCDLVVGGYSDYLAQQELAQQEDRAAARSHAPPTKHTSASAAGQSTANAGKATAGQTTRGKAPPDEASAPAKKALTYGEQLELDKLPQAIDQATQQVEAIQSRLNDPSLYAERPREAQSLHSELSAAQKALEGLEDRWLELEDRRS